MSVTEENEIRDCFYKIAEVQIEALLSVVRQVEQELADEPEDKRQQAIMSIIQHTRDTINASTKEFATKMTKSAHEMHRGK